MADPTSGVMAFKDPNDPMAYQPPAPSMPVVKIAPIGSRQIGPGDGGPSTPVASGIGRVNR